MPDKILKSFKEKLAGRWEYRKREFSYMLSCLSYFIKGSKEHPIKGRICERK